VPHDEPQTFRHSWPAVPESIPAARRALNRWLRALGVAQEVIRDVALALSEAVTNVVRHAYPRGRPGEFRVEASYTGGEVRVLVEDDGAHAEALAEDTANLGLGIPLMQRISGRFERECTPGRGTRVSIVVPAAVRA
jgi:serine/threonine-protein kinase RsbW